MLTQKLLRMSPNMIQLILSTKDLIEIRKVMILKLSNRDSTI